MKISLLSKGQITSKKVLLPAIALGVVVASGAGILVVSAQSQKPVAIKSSLLSSTDTVNTSPSTDVQPVASNSTSTATTSTVAPAATPSPTPTNTTPATTPVDPYQNGYDAWYVFSRRSDVSKTMPTVQTVNANYCSQLASQSFTLSPSQYAVACNSSHHVSFVEQVNSDGSIWISEMNAMGQKSITDATPWGGWGRTDYKLVSAANLTDYEFIQ